jgi:glutathione S-transferase
MRLYLYPPSPRVVGIVALKNHLGLDCELRSINLDRGDQLAPDYVALNPNGKIPTLEDEGFVLWESNAILFYLAARRPESGLWPADLRDQADVMRWLAWESAHWDAESCGMVAFEKASRPVLGLGKPGRWYESLAELPAWRDAIAAKDSAVAALLETLRGKARTDEIQRPGSLSAE